MFSVAGVALFAEEYTIQTISALKESSITPAFEKKVEKSALPVTKKKEGNCNVVTVGRYDDPKKARADLSKVKAVAKDAFIRPIDRVVPKACTPALAGQKAVKTPSPQHTPTSASAPVVEKNKEAAKAGEAPAPVTAAVATEPSAKPSVVAVVEPKEAIKKEETKSVPPKEEKEAAPDLKSSTAIFIYDRNMARKSDIHEAIEYYKNSPYHTFRPVAMQK